MPERPEGVKRILDMARRNLTITEAKLAAFGSINAPTYLVIEYEDQKAKVQELEERYSKAGEVSEIAVLTQTPSSKPIISQGYGYQESERSGANTTSTNTTVEPSTSGEKPPRTKVFISYSHRDKKWLQRLQLHVAPYESDGAVERWDDTLIKPGDIWLDEIKKGLNATKVAVLLITADFLASKFINSTELPAFLDSSEKEGLRILPLIVAPSAFKNTWLEKYQTVNEPSRPLTGLNRNDQEIELTKLAKIIVASLKAKK